MRLWRRGDGATVAWELSLEARQDSHSPGTREFARDRDATRCRKAHWRVGPAVRHRSTAGRRWPDRRGARSPADGYTLLAANDGIITMLPNLQKHVPFDPIRDFSPIAQMIGIPIVLIAHPSVQAKTAQELVQLAKAQPGKLEFSSGGTGSAQQLAMELFMSLTDTRFLHVP